MKKYLQSPTKKLRRKRSKYYIIGTQNMLLKYFLNELFNCHSFFKNMAHAPFLLTAAVQTNWEFFLLIIKIANLRRGQPSVSDKKNGLRSTKFL